MSAHPYTHTPTGETREEVLAREAMEFPIIVEFCNKRGIHIHPGGFVEFDTKEQGDVFRKALLDIHKIDIPPCEYMQISRKWISAV